MSREKIIHNFKLLLREPKRAFYFMEGHVLWYFYRMSVQRALQYWGNKILTSIMPQYLIEMMIRRNVFLSPAFKTKLEAWVVTRYLINMSRCRACFSDGGCVKCGCDIDKMFISSYKCKGNGEVAK